jgi:GAF domain-containing protein
MNQVEMVTQENASLPEGAPLPEGIRVWQQQLIRGILRAMVVVGALALAGGSYTAYTNGNTQQIAIYLGTYAILVLITFWRRAPYSLQVGAFVSLIYALSLFELLEDGLSGSGRVFLLTFTVIVVLFFGRRSAPIALGISGLTLAAFGWAFLTGRIVVPLEALATSLDVFTWVSSTIVFLMVAGMMVISLNYLLPTLVEALDRSRRLAQELEAHRIRLEEHVTERTRDLEQHSRYLEATVEVARGASSVLDLQELLSRVVTLVSRQFDFYHVGIFLLDPSGEWAVLRAANSEGGQRMLVQGHRLRVGQVGMVGYVASRGEPRIALDVGADAAHFDNPELPDTRSEVALPLRARGEIIGVLDVQSAEPEAFSTEDVAVLQALADQVAMAISNARLFEQAQEALKAERRVYGELSREVWRELLGSQPQLSFRSSQQGVFALGDRRWPEMEKALRTGQTALEETGGMSVAMPVKVRGQVIGVVGGRRRGDAGEWTAEEVSLLEVLTEQLSLALDSSRLYQDAQRRAEHERLTSQVTARMRETLDMETVLKTAAEEMRQALDLDRVLVRLVPSGTDGDSNGL